MADLGDGLRADLAERGWSADLDFGRRISFRDARALVAALASDPSTRCGSSALGVTPPMRWGEVLLLGAVGGEGAVRAVAPGVGGGRGDAGERAFSGTDEEQEAALARMASIWTRGAEG